MTSVFSGVVRFKAHDPNIPRAEAEFVIMNNGWLKIGSCDDHPDLVGRMYPPTEIVYAKHDTDGGGV